LSHNVVGKSRSNACVLSIASLQVSILVGNRQYDWNW